MSELFNNDITGDVERLIQIGEVKGDVFIVSNSATQAELPKINADFASDATELVRVFVKSNRFGRKIEFRVPHEITVNGFIDIATNVLRLPWSRQIPELMISFDFRYAVIFDGSKLPLSQPLKDAGITDGNVVKLSITSVWTDKIEEAERREKEMGTVLYEMGSRMQALAARNAARAARGKMTRSKIKALADECFRFVDAVPEND